MEYACVLCFEQVKHNKPHPALKKVSQIEGSTLYKCSCCYAYLHKCGNTWDVISGGELSEHANFAVDNSSAEPVWAESQIPAWG